MSLIKVAWCVSSMKNMHPGSPSDPSWTAAAKAKPRYVYSISKPHGQSSGSPVRIYYSSISSRPQCRSQAVVCVSTPRKYPLRGYILGVLTHTTACDRLWLSSSLTCLLKLWPCGFKIEYTHLGFASAGAVWLGIWNSDHVVLKLSIRTSASPWREQSDLASGTLTMWV